MLSGVAAAFVLGPWEGAALTAVAVVLAVVIIGENRFAEPLVWLPVAVGVGMVGERVRRGDELRRSLLDALRQGLVSLVQDPEVGPLVVVSRYVPAEAAQVLAGDFYGEIQQPSGRVAVMVGDVAGHGPSAAAIATRLRAAWRGLASADVSAPETVSDPERDVDRRAQTAPNAGHVRDNVSASRSTRSSRRLRCCSPATRRRSW